MGGQMKSVTGVTYLNCPLFMNNSIKHTSQTYPQILKDLKKKQLSLHKIKTPFS